MKKLLILFFASLLSSSAFATLLGPSNLNSQNQGQAQGQATIVGVEVSNRISSDSRSNATSFAASATKSQANNSVSTGGNTLTVNEAPIPANTSVTYGGEYTVKNVPTVVTGNIYPTAPCMGSSTVGGAGVGFGFSVGTSWKDDECGIRETARSFNGMGMKEDALAVLCTSEYAKAAPACMKAVTQPAQ